jgi:putative endonuclease
MARTRKDLGERGEVAALGYLANLGYIVVQRNQRQRTGEVDLLLRDGEVLVFCEVKTSRLGFAGESYTARQQKRMRNLILSHLARTNWPGPVRVDLIALDRDPDAPHLYKVNHFQDILSIDDDWV